MPGISTGFTFDVLGSGSGSGSGSAVRRGFFCEVILGAKKASRERFLDIEVL